MRIGLFFTCICLLGSLTGQAAPLLWTVNTGNFGDGGTLTGSFIYDAVANSVLSFNLNVTTGSEGIPAFTYNPGNSTASASSDVLFSFVVPGVSRYLTLQFDNPLVAQGATVTFQAMNSNENYNAGSMFLFRDVGGSVTSSAVPELNSERAVLPLSLMAGLLLMVSRRRQKVVAA